ncbi:MAG: hypothetical protein II752_00930, partial [Muribaculaceae bacterium]|nr:hypothetical protein [Muribaculaceae bacterium]
LQNFVDCFAIPNWVECRWLGHRGLPFRQHPLRHLPEPLRGFLTPHSFNLPAPWCCKRGGKSLSLQPKKANMPHHTF